MDRFRNQKSINPRQLLRKFVQEPNIHSTKQGNDKKGVAEFVVRYREAKSRSGQTSLSKSRGEPRHRRTISHDRVKLSSSMIRSHPTHNDSGISSTRNKGSLGTHGLDPSSVRHSKDTVKHTLQSLMLGQVRTTPGTTALSPAHTKQKFLQLSKQVALKKGHSIINPFIDLRNVERRSWDLRDQSNILSKSFHTAGKGSKIDTKAGNQTPSAGKTHLDNGQFMRMKTFDARSKLIAKQRDINTTKLEDIPRISEIIEEGKAMLSQKKYEAAIDSLNQAILLQPKNIEARFFRGVAFLDSQDTLSAISDLKASLEMNPRFNKTVFMVLSIAYQRLGNIDNALNILSKGLNLFPQFVDLLIERAKIYTQQRQWEKALKDYRQVIQLAPYQGIGHAGIGECLSVLGDNKKALEAYSRAIEIEPELSSEILEKRAILNYKVKEYQKACQDFSRMDSKNPKIQYYRGKICYALRNRDDAVLAMEQIIGQSEDERWTNTALYFLAKMRSKEKNFYEAFHTLNRISSSSDPIQKIQTFQLLIEGIVYMIKRKSKGAIKRLTRVIESTTICSYYFCQFLDCGFC